MRLKATLKRGVKRAARMAGALCRPAAGRSLILTYHSVGCRDHDMNVTPAAFEEQVRWLAKHRPVISLDDAARAVPGVALTFDDGFRDNLVHAAPVLRELVLPATVFIVSGRVGSVLADEPDPEHGGLMDWEDIREIEKLGVTIGAHTRRHRRLASLSPEEQETEIRGCKADIEAELGHPIRHLAYPYGAATDYDETTITLARAAGFTCAVSNRYGINSPVANRWQLRRIWIDVTDDMDMFRAKVTGQLDLLRHLEGGIGLGLRRLLNRWGR